MSRCFGSERLLPMKKPAHHLIAEIPRSSSRVGMTIGIDLGDVWSHYCTLNEDGEVVDRGRFRTSPSGVEKGFTDFFKESIELTVSVIRSNALYRANSFCSLVAFSLYFLS